MAIDVTTVKVHESGDRSKDTLISGPALSQMLTGKIIKSVEKFGLDTQVIIYLTDGCKLVFTSLPRGPLLVAHPKGKTSS